ncbi:MAG: hypothetical protein TRG1_3536 [Flavobacteriaceae bacterium FS1-H7996/R]|nr:MAG: hypothetical protein TRG1_3536 [Flavobacteriaceae bacterium FS1-H7996/R]
MPDPETVKVNPEVAVHWFDTVGAVTVGKASSIIVTVVISGQPLASFTYTSQTKSDALLVSTVMTLLLL